VILGVAPHVPTGYTTPHKTKWVKDCRKMGKFMETNVAVSQISVKKIPLYPVIISVVVGMQRV